MRCTVKLCTASLRPILALLLILLQQALYPPSCAAAESVSELVEAPPLPPFPQDGDWDSLSRYFLTNIYNAIQKNEYPQANGFVDKLLEAHADNPRVLQIAIHVKARLGDWPGVERCLSKFLLLRSDSTASLIRRGFANARMGRLKRARHDYQEVIARHPSPELKEYTEKALGKLQVELAAYDQKQNAAWSSVQPTLKEFEDQRDWSSMEAALTSFLDSWPESDRALFARGEARNAQRRFSDAEADYRTALLMQPAEELKARIDDKLALLVEQRRASQWAEARALQEKGNLAGLERFLVAMLAEYPDDIPALVMLGRTRLQLDSPHLEEVKVKLAAALAAPAITEEEHADAEEALAAIVARLDARQSDGSPSEGDSDGHDSFDEWAALQQTEASLRDKEDWAGLDEFYTDLIDRRVYLGFAYSRRGDLRLRMDRYREAKADFAAAMAQSDINPEAKKDLEATIAKIDDALKADDEWQGIQQTEASLSSRQDWKGLEDLYTDLINRHAYLGFAYSRRGDLRLQMDRYSEARADFAAAMAEGDVAPEAKKNLESTIAKIDADLKADEEWKRVQQAEASFTTKQDWSGLEDLYTHLIEQRRYLGFAYSGRGSLRLRTNRYDEAKSDLVSALAQEDISPEAKKNLESTVAKIDALHSADDEWKQIQQAEAALREKKDWEGLEKLYGDLIARQSYLGFAYSSRGYLHLQQGQPVEASRYLRAALGYDLTPEAQANIRDTLERIYTDRQTTAKHETIRQKVATLAEARDWFGVESFYDKELRQNPGDAYILTMRGLTRLDLGCIDKAESDFRTALTLNPDDQTRTSAEEALRRIEDAAAQGKPLESPKAEEYLARIGELVDAKQFEKASPLVEELRIFFLSDSQKGRNDFFAGEILWARGERDAAYSRYVDAVPRLERGYYLSEALWKMSEYNYRKKDKALASEYARQSVAAMPDLVWRNVQAGDMYANLRQDREAIDSYERALSDGSLAESDLHFLGSLANSYLRQGDRGNYHRHMRRQIDIDTDKAYSTSAPDEKAVRNLYRLRRDYSNMSKQVKGYQFVFADSYSNGDSIVQYQNEINLQFGYRWNIRAEAYFQTIATLSSSFSGEYFDTWNGVYRPYPSQANLGDGINVVIGGRFFPFPAHGLSIGLDKVFAIGRETRDDARLHLSYFGAIGNYLDPISSSWNYGSLWGDAIYSLQYDDFTFRGEGRFGRTYRVDRINPRFTVTPYIGATVGYGGKNMEPSERYILEAGPGIMFRQWFREDKYHAPRANVDLLIQYRFGLSKNRSNVFSVTLFHSF